MMPTSLMPTSFKSPLARAQAASGLSQVQVPRRAGLRADRLNRIINDRAVPSARERVAIAAALGVAVTAVFSGDRR